MRDLVTHIPTGYVLDLSAPDYGHPEGRSIVAELHRRMSRTSPVLTCEHGKPVYLQERETFRGSTERRMWGIHFDGTQCRPPSPGMSDEHKRQTDYILRAGEEANHPTKTEVRLATRVRPDGVIYGPEPTAVEVQRAALTRTAAVSRTRKAIAGGMSASVWFSDWQLPRKPQWLFRVPSIGMTLLPWDTVPPKRAVTVTTGARVIRAAKCNYSNFDRCPETKRRPCGQFHVSHSPWPQLTVDDVAAQMPSGEIVPLRYLGKDVLIVSRASLALYEELTGKRAELVFNPAAEHRLRTSAHDRRVPCDHDEPTHETPTSPVTAKRPTITLPPRGTCGAAAGANTCGAAPARLYPNGWRCPAHQPADPSGDHLATASPPGSSWAAQNLGHLPGRCHGCGWHIKIQGHAPHCTTRGGAN